MRSSQTLIATMTVILLVLSMLRKAAVDLASTVLQIM